MNLSKDDLTNLFYDTLENLREYTRIVDKQTNLLVANNEKILQLEAKIEKLQIENKSLGRQLWSATIDRRDN